MTEAEAFKRWCPFARVVFGEKHSETRVAVKEHLPSGNRLQLGDGMVTILDASACVGSACMAWREAGPGVGYCGLVGKPHGVTT